MENAPLDDTPIEKGQRTPPRTSEVPPHIKDTPHTLKMSSNIQYTSTYYTADTRNAELRNEVKGYIVGPMPAATFLEKYLPKENDTPPVPFIQKEADEFLNSIRKALEKENEKVMYPIWVEHMKRYNTNFHVRDVSQTELANLCGSGVKPDVVVHTDPLEMDNKFRLQAVELIGEFKPDGACDPFFNDRPGQIESIAKHRLRILGQITSYATCHMAMQARTHVFQFVVFADYARLLRWDRAGVVVTEKIPLNHESLADFFWRFDHLIPADRGWDMTMTAASDDEIEEAKDKLKAAEGRMRLVAGEMSPHYTKITLPGGGSYIVHRIFYSGTQSPFGRATRAYAAYSFQKKKVVFLKSTWQILGEGRTPEHETYKLLHEAQVKHIPTVVEYAEIHDHTTRTQELLEDATNREWMKGQVKSLRKLQQYFLVLEELGCSLRRFNSSKELLTSLSHAAEAHRQAHDNALILHRDISAGNIIIVDDGERPSEGLLIDWDLAKSLADIQKGGSQPERTGTYQFMAARFLQDDDYIGTPHERLDDVESIFHVLQWIVLRYANHGIPPRILGKYLYQYFDDAYPRADSKQDLPTCSGRLTCIQLSVIWTQSKCPNLSDFLISVLEDIRDELSLRYISFQGGKGPKKYQYNSHLDKHVDENAERKKIKLERLQTDSHWLPQLLQGAANDPGCPTDDKSTRQDYTSHGTKVESKSEVVFGFLPIEYCNRDRPAKRQRRSSRIVTASGPSVASTSGGTSGLDFDPSDFSTEEEDQSDGSDSEYFENAGRKGNKRKRP